MAATEITWIPAHPSYGSVSMRRYWQALDDQAQDTDRYRIRSVIGHSDRAQRSGWQAKAERLIQRRWGYPAVIRRHRASALAHVLDHSWADMLAAIPAGIRTVVTVHDLIPLRFRGELQPAQLARFRSWVENLKLADAVISVSEYTKRETVDLLGIDPGKIHVVPNGADLPAAASGAGGLQWIEKKLAAVGARNGVFRVGVIGSTIERKNLKVLPAALAALKAVSTRRPVLVRVGPPLAQALADELKNVLGADGLVELGRLRDDELAGFYGALDCVAVPSLYEGFGLPVLEGMAAGVPVVCSRSSSIPEVGGERAMYFDPESPEEFGDRLAELERDGVSEMWLEAARTRARGFTWRKTLEGFFKVYDEVLG